MTALSSVTQAAEPTLAGAQAAYLRGDYASASVDYESVARSASGPFAADYWLLAADAAVRGGDGYRADQLLNRLDRQPLDEHQAGRLQLLRGQAALARNDTATALRYLPENSSDDTLRDAVLLARGRALYRSGDALGGTAALVKRETSLASAEALQANRAAIWLGVTSTPSRPLAPGQAIDTATRGWLELGRLAQQQPAPLAELDAWRKRYPGHPAEERIAQLMMPSRDTLASRAAPAISLPAPASATRAPLPPTPPAAVAAAAPGPAPVPVPPPAPAASAAPLVSTPAPTTPPAISTVATPAPVAAPGASVAPPASPQPATPTGPADVALLLPLSGPLAQAGAAVREAFSSIMPARVYDTGGSADGAVQAYRRAASEGATVAVGPMVKEGAAALAALAASGTLPIPLLTLNYLDSSATHADGLYQFGLAPEDEAAAAAEDAYARGLHRAVTMTPTGEWGERVLAAFRNRLSSLGGLVVDSVRYVPGTNDYGTPIRSLLKLSAAEARRKAVSGALGISTEFTPQPRGDTDYLFIAARAAQARLIVPQLRYYRAQELPVYATSAAYDGGDSLDIAGLRICDVPVVMQEGVTGPVDVARLGALGRDAAQLAQAIRSHVLAPGATLAGATGRLTVDSYGAVHRQLNCASITESGLKPLR